MAVESEMDSGIKEGPFHQFTACPKTGDCKYKDANGICVFENCIVDGMKPPAQLLHYFECIICKHIDAIDPKDMKAHICSTCIGRMQAVEALPVPCNWCGQTISAPTSWMFSGLCETCIGKIKAAAGCKLCGRSIP